MRASVILETSQGRASLGPQLKTTLARLKLGLKGYQSISSRQFVVTVLITVAVVHRLAYRGLFGEQPLVDFHPPREVNLVPIVVSIVIVLAAVFVASARLSSRKVALQSAMSAGVATTIYFVLSDALRVGWGGAVAHDVWFGDGAYWMMTIARCGMVVVAYLAVVWLSWAVWAVARNVAAG